MYVRDSIRLETSLSALSSHGNWNCRAISKLPRIRNQIEQSDEYFAYMRERRSCQMSEGGMVVRMQWMRIRRGKKFQNVMWSGGGCSLWWWSEPYPLVAYLLRMHAYCVRPHIDLCNMHEDIGSEIKWYEKREKRHKATKSSLIK